MLLHTPNGNLSEIKAFAANGQSSEAFAVLRSATKANSDFVTQRKYARLLSQINAGELGLRPLRVAVLASCTTDHLVEILKLWLALEGFAAEIYTSPYDTVTSTILNPDSDFYGFRPEIVWLLSTWRDLRLTVPAGAGIEEIDFAVGAAVDDTVSLWKTVKSRCPVIIIQNNADIPAIDIFGNYEGSVAWSARSLMRRYNLRLGECAEAGVSILDLDHLSSTYGKRAWFEERYWHHSKHAFAFDALPPVCFSFSRLVGALKGLAKKCLVLDLDNTLWGGVIGDDGLQGIRLGTGAEGEAFVHFQKFILSLKKRGVILAVCSKNEQANAREVFEKHPDMVLTLDDIAVFRANWDNKADNIRAIADILNIGLDSMVFIDDNPAERALVREFLPMIAVPELPEDPSGYIEALHQERYFETGSYSQEDGERAEYYRANAARNETRVKFTDETAFRASLKMECEIGELTGLFLPRSSQLINKSNQFHLTGTRYNESEISSLLQRPDWIGRHFILRDRFGDNGLISVVLMRRDDDKLHIDTWVMSCRVLGRSMEEFIANEIAAVARDFGCRSVIGRYVRSKKNKLVENLYQRLGFSKVAEADSTSTWMIGIETLSPWATEIARQQPARLQIEAV
jgi:FkbH-like protein